MKKILILISAVFLLTGCDVTYNLEFKDDTFKENINITEKVSDLDVEYNDTNFEDMFESTLNTPIALSKNYPVEGNVASKIKGISYYKISDTSNYNKKSMNIKGKFSKTDFQDSQLANFACASFAVENKNGVIYLKTSTKMKIFEQYSLLDNLTINIKTNQNVLSNNADVVKGNTYTWNINEENYLDKTIYMEIKLKSKSFSESQIEMAIMFTVLVIIAGIIYLFVKGKGQKNNSI